MGKLYRVHEFAQRAGVTIKALYHYDRLGLLKARRTPSGYRLYGDGDIQRLEQIAALKFLGIPLRQVKAVLDRGGMSLADALRRQRFALEENQRMVSQAIRAIQDAEEALRSDRAAEAAAWKRIIEVIAMQNDSEAMKKYYSEAAWSRRKHHYDQWPSPAWQEVCRQAASVLDEELTNPRVQAFKARWTELVNQEVTGDPEIQAGAVAAWNDRTHWPAALREKIQVFRIEQVVEFLARMLAASWKAYVASEAWARLSERQRNPTEPWNEWYRRARVALEEDPPGAKAQALVLRMTEL